MNSSLFTLLALLNLQMGPVTEPIDELLEHTHKSHSAHFASGYLASRSEESVRRYPWPVKLLSIGHTIGSYQNYGGQAYFHHGLDIRADAGSPVYASRGGRVVNIENYVPGNSKYWEIAILDSEGFLWQYHHVDKETIPSEVLEAFKNGGSIADGAKIGTVVYWPVVSFGERFNHIHLNVLSKDQGYLNAFLFLEKLNDTSVPEISEIGLLKDGGKWEEPNVSGPYSLYLEVKDLILSNVFTVPPNSIDVSIDNGKPFTVWEFNSLPGGADEYKFVHDFYVARMACGDYQCRKQVIDLGFKKIPHSPFPSASGKHEVTVRVKDDAGNSTERDFTYLLE